jgi:hypothetical protein
MSQTVDPDAFRRWMAPTVEVFTTFVAAVDDVLSRPPAANSQAMRELAEEDGYRARSSWEKPVSDSLMLGALTLRAAADCVRTFANAFSAGPTPVYGHLVVARSALESSVVSAWLNEPGIAYLERVKRGMCELLYSAREVERLELPGGSARGVAALKADATSLRWEAHFDRRGKPVVDGIKRPSVPNGITQLLRDDPQSQIGRLLWNRLSAVTHVTWWGLRWAIEPTGEESGGFATVSVGTGSTQVAAQAFYVLRALQVAATQRVTLMGWNDDQWQAACYRAEEHEAVLVREGLGN